MASRLLTEGLVLLAAVHCVSSTTYTLSDSLKGQNFLKAFTWQTEPDANYGRVNYLDYETAKSKGLVSVDGDAVTLRADSTTVLKPHGPGRDSFYLKSKKQYSTHVAVFDIAHMPTGCGTWPAVWSVALSISIRELGANWPNGGEVDIVEGVNNQAPNRISLHASAGCTMPSDRSMSGTSLGTNCDVYQTANAGCGVSVNTPSSFGPDFNAVRGGWYAIERTSSFVKVFFWPRWEVPPLDILVPGDEVNTDKWGTPVAYFPDTSCNFATHLSSFNIMIDLDFCGAWAGNTYGQSGCPSTCVDFVNNHATAFGDAYFTFNAVYIYR